MPLVEGNKRAVSVQYRGVFGHTVWVVENGVPMMMESKYGTTLLRKPSDEAENALRKMGRELKSKIPKEFYPTLGNFLG